MLSADFLVDLLTGSTEDAEVHHKGVRIANGVVAERLDLELAEISHETRLTGFRFEGDVDLSRSVFLKGISFAGSSFRSANFSAMKVLPIIDLQFVTDWQPRGDVRSRSGSRVASLSCSSRTAFSADMAALP